MLLVSMYAMLKQHRDKLGLFTCPKKATLKYVPSSLLPVCITSITLVYARWRVSYRCVSFCAAESEKNSRNIFSLLKTAACCRKKHESLRAERDALES